MRPFSPLAVLLAAALAGSASALAQTPLSKPSTPSDPLCVSLAERLNLHTRLPAGPTAAGGVDAATAPAPGAELSAELLRELRQRAGARRDTVSGDPREPLAGRIDFRLGPRTGAEAGEPGVPSPLFRGEPNGSVDSLLIVEQTLWATPAASTKMARAWYSYVKLAWAGGALESLDSRALRVGTPGGGLGIHDAEVAPLHLRGREAAGVSAAAAAAAFGAPADENGYRLLLNEKVSLRPDVERLPFPAANLRGSAWMGSVRLSIVY